MLVHQPDLRGRVEIQVYVNGQKKDAPVGWSVETLVFSTDCPASICFRRILDFLVERHQLSIVEWVNHDLAEYLVRTSHRFDCRRRKICSSLDGHILNHRLNCSVNFDKLLEFWATSRTLRPLKQNGNTDISAPRFRRDAEVEHIFVRVKEPSNQSCHQLKHIDCLLRQCSFLGLRVATKNYIRDHCKMQLFSTRQPDLRGRVVLGRIQRFRPVEQMVFSGAF